MRTQQQGRRARVVLTAGAALIVGLSMGVAGTAWAQEDKAMGGLAAMGALAVLILLAAGVIAACLVVGAVCPRFARRTRLAAANHTRITLVWGLCLLFLVLIVTALFGAAGELGGVFIALGWSVLLALTTAGFAGVAWALGERLLAKAGSPRAEHATAAILVGAVSLCIAAWVPILGQIIAAASFIMALGCFAQALFHGASLDREAALDEQLPRAPEPAAAVPPAAVMPEPAPQYAAPAAAVQPEAVMPEPAPPAPTAEYPAAQYPTAPAVPPQPQADGDPGLPPAPPAQ